MILAEMSQWRPTPGRLSSCRPSAASLTAAEASLVDPGPPSFLQQDHLRAYAALVRRGGHHRAWTGVATEIDGALDREALTRALRRFVSRHEGMRTWFDLSGAEPVRHLVPAQAVDFEIVDVAPAAADDSAADDSSPDVWQQRLQEHLTDRFDAVCRPDAWPGFALEVVESADRFGLAWGCDHAFTDGVSQILLASELADLYAEEAGGETDAARPGEGAEPAAEGFLGYVSAERTAAASYDASSPEVREWVEIVASHGGRLPSFPLDLGLGPGETAPVRIRHTDLLDAADLARVDAVCRVTGARLTAGVFAALAETERLLTGAEDYFGVTVLSTRGTGPWATAQGWFCTFAPVSFGLGGCATFADAVAAAHEGFERAKRLAATPVHLVLETLVTSGTTPPEALGSPQLVSYIDLRWFPGVATPAHARGVHFTGAGRTANASMWVNRDAERLYVVAQTPDSPVAQQAVTTYHETLRAVLRAGADGRLLEGADARHQR